MNLLLNNIQFSKLNPAITLNCWETDVILKTVQNNLAHIFSPVNSFPLSLYYFIPTKPASVYVHYNTT